MWSFRSILMITASLMKASNLCPDLKYNDLKRYLRGRRIEKVKENNSILFLEIRAPAKTTVTAKRTRGQKHNRFRLEKQQLFCDARLRSKTPYFEFVGVTFPFSV